MSYIVWLDTKLFYLINIGTQNRFFDLLMPFVTNFKNWWPLIVPVVIGLLGWGGKKGRVAVVVIAIAVGVSDYSSGKVIKYLIGRIRPCNVLEGVHLLVYCGKYSFPSSHASNMAAMLITAGYYYKKALIPLFVLTVVIGYSRIYVGVHYPLDVMGGYVWGCAVGLGTIMAAKRLTNIIPLRSANHETY